MDENQNKIQTHRKPKTKNKGVTQNTQNIPRNKSGGTRAERKNKEKGRANKGK